MVVSSERSYIGEYLYLRDEQNHTVLINIYSYYANYKYLLKLYL